LVYRYGGNVEFREFHECIAEWDVAIAPLIDCEMNRCKSPQKWFERALHETPMVVSDMLPYSCFEHGVTGFKARDADEFTHYLKRLSSDADLRARMYRAARGRMCRRSRRQSSAHNMSADP